jgi:hypothetical protein
VTATHDRQGLRVLFVIHITLERKMISGKTVKHQGKHCLEGPRIRMPKIVSKRKKIKNQIKLSKVKPKVLLFFGYE